MDGIVQVGTLLLLLNRDSASFAQTSLRQLVDRGREEQLTGEADRVQKQVEVGGTDLQSRWWLRAQLIFHYTGEEKQLPR